MACEVTGQRHRFLEKENPGILAPIVSSVHALSRIKALVNSDRLSNAAFLGLVDCLFSKL